MRNFRTICGPVLLATLLPALAWAGVDDGGGSISFGGMLVKMLLVLLVVCFLIFVFLKYIAAPMHGRGKRGGSRMVIFDQLRIDPKRSIAIVRVAQRFFLVGIADNAINTLAELNPADVGPLDETPPPRFANIFQRWIRPGSVADNPGKREG